MFCAVDVSADYVDCTLDGENVVRFRNTVHGYRKLHAIVPPNFSIVCEATGAYFAPLALYFYRANYGVFVLNPLVVASYRKTLLLRAKTDNVDARLIHEYAVKHAAELPNYDPLPESLLFLRSVVRFADSLTIKRAGTVNQIHSLSFLDPRVIDEAKKTLQLLDGERDRLYHRAAEYARSDSMISSWLDALIEMPGFGERSGLQFLAYIGDIRRFSSAKKFASYTGLTPRPNQSGNSLGSTPISKMGHPKLRAVLYMAAVANTRSKTSKYGIKYHEYRERGFQPKKALVAVARQLGMDCYYTLKRLSSANTY